MAKIDLSSMSEIYRKNGFFCDVDCNFGEQNTSIGYVFLVSITCLGPIQFIIALINDYVSYGKRCRIISTYQSNIPTSPFVSFSRVVLYLGLTLTYLFMALAEPDSSYFLYVWIIQFSFALCKIFLEKMLESYF